MPESDTAGSADEQTDGFSFPEPPKELLEAKKRGNWKKLLTYFGPGAILASMTLGSGEVLFAPRGRAIFGMAVLWALVWSGIVKGLVAYSGALFR